jgi:hypothetical protein
MYTSARSGEGSLAHFPKEEPLFLILLAVYFQMAIPVGIPAPLIQAVRAGLVSEFLSGRPGLGIKPNGHSFLPPRS